MHAHCFLSCCFMPTARLSGREMLWLEVLGCFNLWGFGVGCSPAVRSGGLIAFLHLAHLGFPRLIYPLQISHLFFLSMSSFRPAAHILITSMAGMI